MSEVSFRHFGFDLEKFLLPFFINFHQFSRFRISLMYITNLSSYIIFFEIFEKLFFINLINSTALPDFKNKKVDYN